MARMRKDLSEKLQLEEIRKRKKRNIVIFFCFISAVCLLTGVFLCSNMFSAAGNIALIKPADGKQISVRCPECGCESGIRSFKRDPQRTGFAICPECRQAVPCAKLVSQNNQ